MALSAGFGIEEERLKIKEFLNYKKVAEEKTILIIE